MEDYLPPSANVAMATVLFGCLWVCVCGWEWASLNSLKVEVEARLQYSVLNFKMLELNVLNSRLSKIKTEKVFSFHKKLTFFS